MSSSKSVIFNKALLSNTLGNVLEWYDFTLYGVLASVIVTFFIEKTHNHAISGIILTVSAILSLIILLTCRETAFEPLK